MEAIKNYLDNMFFSLPHTKDAVRAKEELGAMMEDRYQELIEEGRPENEAVGIVISEFGNLEEVAEELGIGDILKSGEKDEADIRSIDEQTIRSYLEAGIRASRLGALGIFLIVASSVPLLFLLGSDSGRIGFVAGVVILLAMVGIGIGLQVYTGLQMKEWQYIRKESFRLDFSAAAYVRSRYESYRKTRIFQLVIGVVLCVICGIPAVIVVNAVDVNGRAFAIGYFAGFAAVLIVSVAIFLFVLAGRTQTLYLRLMPALRPGPGDEEEWVVKGHGQIVYASPVLQGVMSVYWPTAICLYLIVSFLTFAWSITWIIWPAAGIISAVIAKKAKKKGKS